MTPRLGDDEPVDAVLVVSFGGPEGPDDVLPFLENVTRGRGIPRERLLEVAQHYYSFGGISPINEQNRKLVAALEHELAAHGPALPVFWGNRNWAPYLPDTVAEMVRAGVRHAAAFVTAGYAGLSSCRQYRQDIERARAGVPGAPRITKLRHFFDHPGFVDPMVRHTLDALNALPAARRDRAHLLFTGHSVPLAMAETAGPRGGAYVAQLTEAARLVAERVDPARPWSLAWQSRSGPPSQPWLEPDVADRLADLAGAGVSAAVLVPIGFVSDHVEVRHDLDVELAERASQLGVAVTRAATVGTAPEFVAMIRELVREVDDAELPRRGLGDPALRWTDCPAGCCGRP